MGGGEAVERWGGEAVEGWGGEAVEGWGEEAVRWGGRWGRGSGENGRKFIFLLLKILFWHFIKRMEVFANTACCFECH